MVDSVPRVLLFLEEIDFDLLRNLPQYLRRMHYYYYYITFIQGIDSYVTETNRVSMVYRLAVWSQYKINVMLFPMINVVHFGTSIFRSMFCAQCGCFL